MDVANTWNTGAEGPRVRNRKAVHTCLCESIHDDWHSLASAYGVSVSALLSALSRRIDSAARRAETHASVLQASIIEARKIDSLRSR